ncbi:MAG: type VI secretion system protein TssA [Deferrisomatales bacterium]|nr:type VI secretion system protein TssA [Deferrisomatales bacterium]
MSVLDVEQLLQPVSDTSPCGEDLEYDPAFGELERLSQRKPEQQMGDTVIPAEEPNWKEVKQRAVELLARGKDLRVAVVLARALTRTDGLLGLEAGLAVVEGLLQRYWGEVHPLLDPDDDNDPTLRVNTLASLCDQEALLGAVRLAPLVSSRGFGRFSLRDVQLATGAVVAPEGTAVPDAASIDGAFMEAALEELQDLSAAAMRATERIRAIETLVTEQVGVGNAVDLGDLPALLREVQHVLSERLAQRGVGPGNQEDPAENGEEASVSGETTAVAARQTPPGEISTREEAVRALDRVCAYFERYEPSSPVPVLLQRAKRLVSKNFLEIIRDLVPDGLSQVEMFRGVDREG